MDFQKDRYYKKYWNLFTHYKLFINGEEFQRPKLSLSDDFIVEYAKNRFRIIINDDIYEGDCFIKGSLKLENYIKKSQK